VRLAKETFVKRTPKQRGTQLQLSPSIHQKLSAYAIAASAAGVSLLALASPAEAEIIYTPANVTIGRNGAYNLDLNHDGIVDFTLLERGSVRASLTFQNVSVRAGGGNKVNCASTFCASTFIYAAALMRGNQIGPGQHRHGWLGNTVSMAFEEKRPGTFVYYAHDWANVSNRYLGLRFQINGETHYGWARLTVKFHGGALKERTWEAQLTGYAYETVAGKPITAGQTKGDAEDISASLQTAQPGTSMVASSASRRASRSVPLGALALGADGIALLRRVDSEPAVTSHEN
jgi:hypothetical protein